MPGDVERDLLMLCACFNYSHAEPEFFTLPEPASQRRLAVK
jgi:hypothetical protein